MIQYISDHLEGVVALLALFVVLHQRYADNKSKDIETYLSLFTKRDQLWSTFTAHPLSNKELFKKDIKDIDNKEENLKLTVFQIVDLLSQVYYYYSRRKKDIRKSDWHKEVKYIMNRKIFRSAFDKYKGRYNDGFVEYIETLNNYHPTLFERILRNILSSSDFNNRRGL
jgi:hypothetical protein